MEPMQTTTTSTVSRTGILKKVWPWSAYNTAPRVPTNLWADVRWWIRLPAQIHLCYIYLYEFGVTVHPRIKNNTRILKRRFVGWLGLQYRRGAFTPFIRLLSMVIVIGLILWHQGVFAMLSRENHGIFSVPTVHKARTIFIRAKQPGSGEFLPFGRSCDQFHATYLMPQMHPQNEKASVTLGCVAGLG